MNKIPQNDNRLYHITANWKNNNNEHFSREFVICAADKTTAETIAKNHIPQALTKNMKTATSTAITDCKLRTRDLGIAQKNRTYFGSTIQNTKRDSVDELSPTEHTMNNISSLWGQEVGYLSNKTTLASIEQNRLDVMTKTNNVATMLYQWTEEYLMSKNTDIITFFETKLSEYTKTEIKRNGSPIINHNSTSHEDLKLVLNQTKKQADLFLKNANDMAEAIVNQANNTANIIKQNTLDEIQTLLNITEKLITSKFEQAQRTLYDTTVSVHEATTLTKYISELYNDACSNQYNTIQNLQNMHTKNGTPLFDVLYKSEKNKNEQYTEPQQIVKIEHVIAQPENLTANLINNDDIHTVLTNIMTNAMLSIDSKTPQNNRTHAVQASKFDIKTTNNVNVEHNIIIETPNEIKYNTETNSTDNNMDNDKLTVDDTSYTKSETNNNTVETEEPIIETETTEENTEQTVDTEVITEENAINTSTTENEETTHDTEDTEDTNTTQTITDNKHVTDMPIDIIEELAEEITQNTKDTASSMANTENMEIPASVKNLEDIPIDNINELAKKLREHDFWLKDPYISHNPYNIGMGDVVYNLYATNKVKDMLRNTHFHISLVNLIGKKRPDLYYQEYIIQLESTLPTNCINEEYTYKLKILLRFIQDILFLCIPNDNSRNYKNAFEPLALQVLDELTQTLVNNQQPTDAAANTESIANNGTTDESETFETNDFADTFGDDFDEFEEESEDITPDYDADYKSQKSNSN